jgi:hypothetical protein
MLQRGLQRGNAVGAAGFRCAGEIGIAHATDASLAEAM